MIASLDRLRLMARTGTMPLPPLLEKAVALELDKTVEGPERVQTGEGLTVTARHFLQQGNGGLLLAGDQELQSRLLQVEALLQKRLASDALGVLSSPPAAGSDQALQVRYYRDLADAYRQTGNLLESANALQAIDAMPADPLQRLATQTEILRTLALLNELVLTNLQPSPPGVSGGWMQLALIVKKYGSDPDQLATPLAEWRQRFPQHPAMPALIENYRLQLQRQMQPASRIAVLLPQSGAYASVGMKVLERAAGHACGPYRWQALDVETIAVRTNNSVCGAFRGFGANQAQFATEGMIDRLAEMVGISGWEMRSRNVVTPGDVWGPGQIMDEGAGGARRCLDAVRSVYEEARRDGKAVGLGLALKNSGLGNGALEISRAVVRFDESGEVQLIEGASA